jgi:hypothetical protein
MTWFRSEKNTNWEGALRVHCLVRWPGIIRPGTSFSTPTTTPCSWPCSKAITNTSSLDSGRPAPQVWAEPFATLRLQNLSTGCRILRAGPIVSGAGSDVFTVPLNATPPARSQRSGFPESRTPTTTRRLPSCVFPGYRACCGGDRRRSSTLASCWRFQ